MKKVVILVLLSGLGFWTQSIQSKVRVNRIDHSASLIDLSLRMNSEICATQFGMFKNIIETTFYPSQSLIASRMSYRCLIQQKKYMQAYGVLNDSKKYGVIIEDLLTQLDEVLILSYQFAEHSHVVASFLDEAQYWARMADRPDIEAVTIRLQAVTMNQRPSKKQPLSND